MKGLNKLALATAVLAASTGAFAMEAMQDDQLSDTTGQSGLTILISNVAASATAVRYYDADGTSGAAAALGIVNAGTFPAAAAGPCAGIDSLTCANNFAAAGGSLSLNGFSVTANSILTTIDIGSTGTGSTATTGLLIGSKITGLNVNLGGISFDNGNELSGASATLALGAKQVNATNAPTYSNGYLATGNDLGGIALTNLNLPSSSAILITPGTKNLGSSGLTITSLIPISELDVTVNYYNSTMEKWNGAAFVANSPTNVANDGLISLPISLYGIVMGPTQIAAGLSGGGYNLAANQGLEIVTGGTQIGAIDIGGASGISIAGTNAGSVGIIGLQVGGSQINVSGH